MAVRTSIGETRKQLLKRKNNKNKLALDPHPQMSKQSPVKEFET